MFYTITAGINFDFDLARGRGEGGGGRVEREDVGEVEDLHTFLPQLIGMFSFISIKVLDRWRAKGRVEGVGRVYPGPLFVGFGSHHGDSN